ncbi:hypothetical protein JMUB7529_28570 [Staphylococcus aureus]
MSRGLGDVYKRQIQDRPNDKTVESVMIKPVSYTHLTLPTKA